ncbi:chorismate mutase [Buchnera aphidicola]|uniref:chorismate mutase n=1 Tax=Buchnera aphidicola TaxID=9 RepID=UPI0031B89B75
MTSKKILLKLRNQINQIDKLILDLLYKRRTLAISIAKKKIIHKFLIQDRTREKELLQNLILMGEKYHLSAKYIKKIFNIIIQDSVTIQTKITNKFIQNTNLKNPIFSFLGPTGSYSYIASMKYIKKYHNNYAIQQHKNFEDILHSVENNQSNYAIVPIENSFSGFIRPVYNLLFKTKLKIIGECYLPINHCLLTKSKILLSEIKVIYSHAQSFEQCSKFIQKYKYGKIKYTNSTSEAMQIVSNMDKNNIAAIGDKNSAKIYQLQTISENISNSLNNNTRFFILTKNIIHNLNIIPIKSTLILTTKKNLLFSIIIQLNKKKIKILQLESQLYNEKPIKEMIYIEILGHTHDEKIKHILQDFEKQDILINILGSYPTLDI